MDERFDDPLFLQRTLQGYAQEYAGLAGAVWGADGQAFIAAYRRLFAPGEAGTAIPPGVGSAHTRYQRAVARSAGLASAIAQEAGRRFSRALAATGPEAPPITTLRELHALWIECGEAAYGEAARGEEFAEVQAELLMALVELRAASA